MATAVIAACLPALKPLAVKIFPRAFSDDATETSPTPWSQDDLGPRPPNVGTISRAFNSLFSKRGEEGQNPPKYYSVKHGKIVQLQSRFSQLSLGPLLEEEGDWRQKLKENKWPLPMPSETYDTKNVLNSTRSIDAEK
jgi:hypothetical protein